MKKLVFLLLALAILFASCAPGRNGNSAEETEDTVPEEENEIDLEQTYSLTTSKITVYYYDVTYEITDETVISEICDAVEFSQWEKVHWAIEGDGYAAEPETLVDFHNGTAFTIIESVAYAVIGTKINWNMPSPWGLENAAGDYYVPQNLVDTLHSVIDPLCTAGE